MRPVLEAYPRVRDRSAFTHCSVSVQMRDKPSQALQTGPLEVVDVAGDRGGEEPPGRRGGLRRQHRRADGDGEILPAAAARNRAAGDRRDLADTARREHRARCRRDHRRRRQDAGRLRDDGRRDGALRLRPRPPDGGAAERRRGGDQGRRAGARSGADPARDEPSRLRVSRLRRRRRPRQGHRGRGGHRRFCRQHSAEDRRGHGAPDRRISPFGDGPHLGHAARLPVRSLRPSGCCGRRWIRAR